VLCGADNWVAVAEWAEDNEVWLKEYLELKQGTASHDTFGRVFRGLDGHTCLKQASGRGSRVWQGSSRELWQSMNRRCEARGTDTRRPAYDQW
jgi:hypothetical protein